MRRLFGSLFNWIWDQKNLAKKDRRRTQRGLPMARLRIEGLEDRTTPAFSFVDSPTLTLTGTGVAESVVFRLGTGSGGPIELILDGGAPITLNNASAITLTSITVTAGDGDDSIDFTQLGLVTFSNPVAISIVGDAGADTVAAAFNPQFSGSLIGGLNPAAGDSLSFTHVAGISANVSALNQGTATGSNTFNFIGFENLTTTNLNDTITFGGTGVLTGTLDTGAGSDSIAGDNANRTYTLTGANQGTISGLLPTGFVNTELLSAGSGNDTVQFNTGGSIGSVNGGAGNNTLIGDNTARTYTISDPDIGLITGLLSIGFFGFGSLAGGSANDSFEFTIGTLSGSIDGGAGVDTIQGKSGIDQIFTITGPNSGTLATDLANGFTNVESLAGLDGNDTFTFTGTGSLSGNINGGLGVNVLTGPDVGSAFTFTANNAGSITGILPGGFSNIESLNGGAGADTFQFATGGVVTTLDAGGGNDLLIGDNTARTYNLVGTLFGTIPGLLSTFFANIESVLGGSADDTFAIGASAIFTGTINGGPGSDQFNVALTPDPNNKTLNIVGGPPSTGPGDALQANGGLFSTVTHQFLGPDSGTITYILTTTVIINYSGLEPVDMNGTTISDLTFILPNAANVAILEDDGSVSPDGHSEIRSANGSFEATRFPHPSNSLTIIGGALVDDITLGSTDPTFAPATVTVNSKQGVDTVRVEVTRSPTSTNILADSSESGGTLENDTIILSDSGLIESITGTVNINYPLGLANVIVDDSANPTARFFLISETLVSSTLFTMTYSSTAVQSLIVNSGSAGDNFNIVGVMGGQTTTRTTTINSGAGSDLIGFSSAPTVPTNAIINWNGQGGTDGFSVAQVTGPLPAGTTLNIAGGLQGGTLNGPDANVTWNVTGVDAGNIPGFVTSFGQIQNLAGGTQADVFVLANGGSLTGTLLANRTPGDNDTLVVDDAGRVFTVTGVGIGSVGALIANGFFGVENLTGGAGPDRFDFTSGGSLVGAVNGGGGSDTLLGLNTATLFTITGANAGSVAFLGGGFTNVESLTSFAANDTFTFAGGTLAGRIDGGAGSDAINGDVGGRIFNISNPNGGSISILAPAGFANIESLVGGGGNDSFLFANNGLLTLGVVGGAGVDTLVGDNQSRTFNVTLPNVGTIAGLLGSGFSGVENLAGGASADVLQFGPNGTLDGNFGGGAGLDQVLLSGAGRTVFFSQAGAGSVVGQLPGGFSAIESLQGTTGDDRFSFTLQGFLAGTLDAAGGFDTLVANNTIHVFQFTGAGSGSVAEMLGQGFTGLESIVGGTEADLFRFANGSTMQGPLIGGAGIDEIVADDQGRTFFLSARDAGSFTGNLVGGFTGVEAVRGGAGPDSFFFLDGGSITRFVDGGAGVDRLVGDNTGRSYALVDSSGIGSISGIAPSGFLGIENVQAGAGADQFQFPFPNITWPGVISGGGGADTINLDDLGRSVGISAPNTGSIAGLVPFGFNQVENIVGGAGADTFGFFGTGSLAGSIAGNGGDDRLFGDDAGRDFFITGANMGSIGQILPAGFTGIETLFGGVGDDRYQFTGAGVAGISGTIFDRGGFDQLVGDNNAQSYLITGLNSGIASGLIANGFTGIEKIVGGAADDQFVFLQGGDLTTSLFPSPIAESLNVSEGVDGGAGNDKIIVNTIAGYTIAGPNSGVIGSAVVAAPGHGELLPIPVFVLSAFTNVENLVASGSSDSFLFRDAGRLDGTIDGGAGPDFILLDDGGRTVTANADAAGVISTILTQGFTNVETIVSGLGVDTFIASGNPRPVIQFIPGPEDQI